MYIPCIQLLFGDWIYTKKKKAQEVKHGYSKRVNSIKG